MATHIADKNSVTPPSTTELIDSINKKCDLLAQKNDDLNKRLKAILSTLNDPVNTFTSSTHTENIDSSTYTERIASINKKGDLLTASINLNSDLLAQLTATLNAKKISQLNTRTTKQHKKNKQKQTKTNKNKKE